jgi:hypothetical protein
MSQEHLRLQAAREKGVAWKKGEPYLSERQRGAVREEYSTLPAAINARRFTFWLTDSQDSRNEYLACSTGREVKS